MEHAGFVILLLSGLFAYASGNARYTGCRDGWLAFQGYCYHFGHGLVHFTEAEHYCTQHLAHVIEIDSAFENAFIKDRLRELKPQCYWLGLKDELAEGVWMWARNNTKTTFKDWYPTEPQNGGDCSVLWPAYDFKWGDFPCTNRCGPLCKARGINEEPGVFGRR